MSEDEIQVLVDFLAENPTAGDVMPGTPADAGRCEWPVAARASAAGIVRSPFTRARTCRWSKSESNRLRDITKAIVAEYRKRVAPLARKGA
jgi:hypothetical protein